MLPNRNSSSLQCKVLYISIIWKQFITVLYLVYRVATPLLSVWWNVWQTYPWQNFSLLVHVHFGEWLGWHPSDFGPGGPWYQHRHTFSVHWTPIYSHFCTQYSPKPISCSCPPLFTLDTVVVFLDTLMKRWTCEEFLLVVHFTIQ